MTDHLLAAASGSVIAALFAAWWRRFFRKPPAFEVLLPGNIPDPALRLTLEEVARDAEDVCKQLGGEINHWRTKIRIGLHQQGYTSSPADEVVDFAWRGPVPRPPPTSVPGAGAKVLQ